MAIQIRRSRAAVLPASVLLSFWVSSAPAWAGQPPARRTTPKQPEYFQWLKSRQDLQDLSRLVLKNGLKLLVAENHETNLAVLGIHLAAGRGTPSDTDYWAAPAAMRMLFAGTQKRTAKQISDQLWTLGIQLQIACPPDEAYVWATFPADQTLKAIELFADLLLGSTFPESALPEVQKGLLLEEGRVWTDSTRGLEGRLPWSASALEMSDWAQVEKGIQELKLSQIQDYWGRARTAANITVVIYGDFLPESFTDLAVRRFKDVPAAKQEPAGAEKKTAPTSAPSTPVYYRQVRSGISRAVLRVAYPIPARKDADYPAMVLVSYLLAEGRTSYLNRHLVEEKKVCSSSRRLLVSARQQPGYLCLTLEGEPSDLDTLEIEFFTTMEHWRKTPPTNSELTRALALAATDFFGRLETAQERASNMLQNEFSGGYQSWAQELDALTKVKAADIIRVAEKYLKFDQAEVTELLPSGSEPHNYTPDSFRKTIQQILGVATQEAQAPEPGDERDIRAPDFAALIKKFASTEIAVAPYRTSILRGPELQIWELHSLPIVDLGIFYPGGLEKEAPEKSGLTRLMLASLLRTSSKNTFEGRLRTLEGWGGRIEPVVEKDFFGYRLRVLAPYAEKAMDLILDVVRNKDFLDQDVEQELRLLKGASQHQTDDPEKHLAVVMAREIYGEHPYGRNPFDISGSLGVPKAAQVLEWYTRLMEEVLPMVIVLGDTPGTSLATYFAKHYSGSKYKAVKPSIAATVPPKETKAVELPAAGPGHRATVGLLGPEGENEETLLMQVAMVAADRVLAESSLPPRCTLSGEDSAELRVARKGGTLVFRYWRPAGESVDAAQALSGLLEKLPSALSRELLEGAKATFLTRQRAESQRRWPVLLRFAVSHFGQNQFFSIASMTEKADAITLEEFAETVKRYLGQEKRVQITQS